MTKLGSSELIEIAEAYFARVDDGDVAGVMALLTPDCAVEVLTHPIVHEGAPAIEAMFKRRLAGVKRAWHGNFVHLTDALQGRVTSRFDVLREGAGGEEGTMDNINLFQFDGPLISRISIWMSGENTLI